MGTGGDPFRRVGELAVLLEQPVDDRQRVGVAHRVVDAAVRLATRCLDEAQAVAIGRDHQGGEHRCGVAERYRTGEERDAVVAVARLQVGEAVLVTADEDADVVAVLVTGGELPGDVHHRDEQLVAEFDDAGRFGGIGRRRHDRRRRAGSLVDVQLDVALVAHGHEHGDARGRDATQHRSGEQQRPLTLGPVQVSQLEVSHRRSPWGR